jgi:hypothetical protein
VVESLKFFKVIQINNPFNSDKSLSIQAVVNKEQENQKKQLLFPFLKNPNFKNILHTQQTVNTHKYKGKTRILKLFQLLIINSEPVVRVCTDLPPSFSPFGTILPFQCQKAAEDCTALA